MEKLQNRVPPFSLGAAIFMAMVVIVEGFGGGSGGRKLEGWPGWNGKALMGHALDWTFNL